MGHGEVLVVAVVGRDAADGGGGGRTPGRQVVVVVKERAATRAWGARRGSRAKGAAGERETPWQAAGRMGTPELLQYMVLLASPKASLMGLHR